METAWFAILAAMLTTYVVLDGFDFGAGILHMVIARDDSERRQVLSAIGPVWDGNEVWLIASGGILVFSFPRAYAAAFSGFYLPLMIVLWLLILRGLSIEWRSHLANPLWRAFFDVGFSFASMLMAVVLGAALGNVVRGVPVAADGYFGLPLFTNLRTGPNIGVLDWYTLLIGLFAFYALALHGALYLTWRLDGPVLERCRALVPRLWVTVIVVGAAATIATAAVSDVFQSLASRPWAWPIVLLIPAGLIAITLASRRGRNGWAFLGSAGFLVGILASTAAGLYPTVLRSTVDPAHSLTVHNAAAGRYGLGTGMSWWFVGMALAIAYFVYLFRSMRGPARPDTY